MPVFLASRLAKGMVIINRHHSSLRRHASLGHFIVNGDSSGANRMKEDGCKDGDDGGSLDEHDCPGFCLASVVQSCSE